MRNVFFSFHYSLDCFRVAQIRNSHVISSHLSSPPFLDKARWEEAKKRPGGIKLWIDEQLKRTTVTIVLIGAQTLDRPWVKYEIAESEKRGNGILGITLEAMSVPSIFNSGVPRIKPPFSNGIFSKNYSHYSWVNDNGRDNIDRWIEAIAPRSNGLLRNLFI